MLSNWQGLHSVEPRYNVLTGGWNSLTVPKAEIMLNVCTKGGKTIFRIV